MAVKKTQMYRKNLDTSETNLYPLTEAQYVSMGNGQTVQEILSDRDSDKYTPVITNSSSTFKVGQGDNVDLSSSMKEGAYDSCVLKGKTMVNCIQEPSSKDVVLPYAFEDGQYVTINDTKESGALGVELKGQTLVNLVGEKREYNNAGLYGWEFMLPYKLTKDARYMVVFNVSGTITDNSKVYLMDNGFGSNSGNTPYPVSFTLGYNKHITTASEDNHKVLRIRTDSQAVNDFKVSDVMLIPYQEGMENWDIPYFEGMTSCKMPILHTVSKNLFSREKVEFNKLYIQEGNLNANKEGRFSEANGLRSLTLSLPQNENFTFSIGHPTGNLRIFASNEKPSIGVKGKKIFGTQGTKVATFNTGDYKYFTIVYYSYNSDNTSGKTEEETIATIQIEEGSAPTSYEAHKSSILSLPEEVVLRSLPNGVCDTFNTKTGVYTQRIGEYVFQDTENATYNRSSVSDSKTETSAFRHNSVPTFLGMKTNSTLYCDKFPTIDGASGNSVYDFEYVKTETTNPYIWFNVKKSKLPSDTIAGFKQWLSQNPITVQYELKTPIVTKINLSSTLKSWNTTTHIYSEIPENSLYPTLTHSNPTYPAILKPSTKYSIVVNSYGNSHTNSAINFNLGGATASTTVGNRVTTITTPSALSNELLTMSGRGNKLNNVMVIEGDVVGDEPYFEGICDCKSPILSNVGKNLFNAEDFCEKLELIPLEGGFICNKSTKKYPFKTNGRTCMTVKHKGDSNAITGKSMIQVNFTDGTVGHTSLTNLKYTWGKPIESIQVNSWQQGSVEVTEIMWYEVNEGETLYLDYEPYKSNTTTFEQEDGKTIVLRSLPDGTCDTLNVETREYVQRIGEVTLDGTKRFGRNMPESEYNKPCVRVSCGSLLVNGSNAPHFNMKADKIAIGHYSYNMNYPVMAGLHEQALYIYIPRTIIGLTTNDNDAESIANAFNSWLTRNPITVQYPLATPIVSTIDVQGFPYAYTSGHVQLSSGHSGQSLTPKVEYSLSANKTGQIDSNTRQVIRQQKQLDDFEAMMLTSLVESAYDKAILQFDYEMQMMSLGGE